MNLFIGMSNKWIFLIHFPSVSSQFVYFMHKVKTSFEIFSRISVRHTPKYPVSFDQYCFQYSDLLT